MAVRSTVQAGESVPYRKWEISHSKRRSTHHTGFGTI